MIRIFTTWIMFVAILQCTIAQTAALPTVDTTNQVVQLDTTAKVKKSSIFSGRPGKAALLSLILPGTGQIYNKSYLRVPFVYAAVGGMGYVMVNNTQSYKCFEKAYQQNIDGVELDVGDKCLTLGRTAIVQGDAATLRLIRDRFNKSRQSAILGFAAVWLANSIDAFVNAHLKDFDIDDDLSYQRPKIHIKPTFGQSSTGGGMVGLLVTF